jgi:hypothetical protein
MTATTKDVTIMLSIFLAWRKNKFLEAETRPEKNIRYWTLVSRSSVPGDGQFF